MGKISDYFNNLLPERKISEIQREIAEMDNDSALDMEMQSVFDNIEVNDTEAAHKALNKIKSSLFSSTSPTSSGYGRIFSRYAVRTAAALFLPMAVLTGYLAYKSNFEAPSIREVTVPFGQTKELILSDGTVLQLNSGTRVTYPEYFKGKNRHIFVDGEVLAEVAKNPRKPFIIESGDVAVEVLGTKFDFKSYSEDDNVELTLLEGSVKFNVDDDRHRDLMMRPGDMVQYAKSSGAMNLQNMQISGFRTFKDNNAIRFNNITMADIVNELERSFGQKIVLLDNNIASRRYLAYFTNSETLDQILAAISADAKIKINKNKGVIYISSR